MNSKDYENILKYIQIRTYIDGAIEDSTLMETLTPDGEFDNCLQTLKCECLDGSPIAPFYMFKQGDKLYLQNGVYVIESVSVDFYSNYPNPGGSPAVIVKLNLKK